MVVVVLVVLVVVLVLVVVVVLVVHVALLVLVPHSYEIRSSFGRPEHGSPIVFLIVAKSLGTRIVHSDLPRGVC